MRILASTATQWPSPQTTCGSKKKESVIAVMSSDLELVVETRLFLSSR